MHPVLNLVTSFVCSFQVFSLLKMSLAFLQVKIYCEGVNTVSG